MAAHRNRRNWWWIVLVILIAAGLAFYWYAKTGPAKKTMPITKEPPSAQKPGVSPAGPGIGGPSEGPSVSAPIPKQPSSEEATGAAETPADKETKAAGPPELAAQGPVEELMIKTEGATRAGGPSSDQRAYCTLIRQRVSDFFKTLDNQAYMRRHRLEKGAYPHFTQILKRLAARPPQPAGEENQQAELISNIFFFFRALERKDLALIKEVMANERDTLEYDLDTFYRWLMLGKACPDPEGVRPSFDVAYRYAGFFLNTTGGRAYLFRRPLRLRLLASYYSLLVVYQTDRLGKNTFGLDVLPFIQPLKEELQHHPDLEYQEEYLASLTRIENHYRQRR